MFLAQNAPGCPNPMHALTKQRILDYIPHLENNILKLEGTKFYLPICLQCNKTMNQIGAYAAVKCTRCSQGLFVFVPSKNGCPVTLAPTALAAPLPANYPGLCCAGVVDTSYP